MTLLLGENIRAQRKAKGLTQEQLAEAMGVSIAAVSKWETNVSAPELTMLVDLAMFFETSVDALLGYGWETSGMGLAAEKLDEFRHSKRYDEGRAMAEKLLVKYPNSFQTVLKSADLFAMMGLERHDVRIMQHAVELYERACGLIDQNTDPAVGTVTLQNEIAQLHFSMGRSEQALEAFKRNNLGGMNSDLIGYILSCEHQPEEALQWLGESFCHMALTGLFRVVTGCVNAFEDLNRPHKESLDLLQWLIQTYEGLRLPDSTLLDRPLSALWMACAEVSARADDEPAARQFAQHAMECAQRFDAAPEYRMTSLRFYHGNPNATMYDSFSPSAADALGEMASEANSALLKQIWNEIQNG